MQYRAWTTRPVDRAAAAQLAHRLAQLAVQRQVDRALQADPGAQIAESEKAVALARQAKRLPLLAGVLAARGITDAAEADAILSGGAPLSDPFLLKDMDKAAARILRAVDEGEPLVVFGDYDVDGVTATALLYQHLKGMGAEVKCMLPSREGDGYGLSKTALKSIYDKGYRLVVTVDNGISAAAEADYAAQLGMDLVITDHHLPPETLPRAIAVVDPRRADDTSPCKGLSGAGVAFKLCAALDGCTPDEMLEYCGDLAAIGTVADVMPLTGENRTLVQAGLAMLQQSDRPGINALLDAAGLAGKTITAESISFALAPRLNAAGRMDSAVTALQLVLCEDDDRAAQLAEKLCQVNAARQAMEQQIMAAADAQLAAEPDRMEDRVVLVWGRDWHPGVIGIVASRLVERLGRPVVVISIDEAGEAKGSGRSTEGFDLHGCIAACADLLIRYGGHSMAAGLSAREEALPALRKRMNQWAAREYPVPRRAPLQADLSIRLDKLSVEAVQGMEQLAPFGGGNPAPLFLLENAVIDGVYPVSEGRHSRLRLRQGGTALYAAYFGMPPARLPYAAGAAVDCMLTLSVYEGKTGPQLSGRITALRPAGLGSEPAEQAALFEALCHGTPLSAGQKQLLRPARSDIIAVYREVQSGSCHADDLQPLFARLGPGSTGRILCALTALQQLGLAAVTETDGAPLLTAVPTSQKKELAQAPILKSLEGTDDA